MQVGDGGLPAVAHLHPARASADPDSRVTLRLSAASVASVQSLAADSRSVTLLSGSADARAGCRWATPSGRR
ncbi:hypothetical protein MAHJHV54_49430 [Mycobacterium avium subsp. hominissuis]